MKSFKASIDAVDLALHKFYGSHCTMMATQWSQIRGLNWNSAAWLCKDHIGADESTLDVGRASLDRLHFQTIKEGCKHLPKFDLTLHIVDINNIPLVAGSVCVKWHLPTFSGAEHRGRTDKASIRDHKAVWDYRKEIPVRLTIDKAQNLQTCEIDFEVVQEYFQGARDGRVVLGNVRLNLAEYTNLIEAEAQSAGDKDENEDGMITRRYLMQNSKVNATVKIGIRMKQTEGDINFVPPPLKSAMVIGGIAGIMNAEAGENEDMPSLTSKTRELTEGQDIYRRTLAATWACQAGELPPDRLIEDLFAGGDGGKMDPPMSAKGHGFRFGANRDSVDESTSEGDSRRMPAQNLLSPDSAKHGHGHGHRHGHGNAQGQGHRRTQSSESDYHGSQNSISSTISGRGSIEQQMQHSHASRRKQQIETNDLTEFDIRDDLRSWQVHVN